jgi:hypothetical protein
VVTLQGEREIRMRIRRVLGAVALATSVSVGGVTVGAAAAPSMHTAPQGIAAPHAVAAPSVLAGQFCKSSDVGKVVTADNGARVKCVRDGAHNRWVVK